MSLSHAQLEVLAKKKPSAYSLDAALAMANVLELDRSVNNEDGDLTFLELQPASGPDAFERVEALEIREFFRRALDCFNARDRHILQARVLTEEIQTLDAVGADLGISRERVRQLERTARSRLIIKLSEMMHRPLPPGVRRDSKMCTRCGEWRDVGEFRKRNADGLVDECYDCRTAKRAGGHHADSHCQGAA